MVSRRTAVSAGWNGASAWRHLRPIWVAVQWSAVWSRRRPSTSDACLLVTTMPWTVPNGCCVYYRFFATSFSFCFTITSLFSLESTSGSVTSPLLTYLLTGTGIRGLRRGLATLPSKLDPGDLVVRDKDGRPQEDPLAVHCFCVCSGSVVLLGDLLGVSRSIPVSQ